MAAQRGPSKMQDFMEDKPKEITSGATSDPSQRGEVADMRMFGNYMQDVPSEVGNTSTPAVYTEPTPADPSQRGKYTDQIKDTVTQESEGYSPTGNIYNPGYTGPDGSNSGQFDQGSTLGSLNDSDVYLGSHTGGSQNPAQDANTSTTTSTSTTEAAKEAKRLTEQQKARDTQQEIADDSQGYLAKNDLLNEYTAEDIYLRNDDGTPKLDPTTGEPLVRPELQSDDAVLAGEVLVNNGEGAFQGNASQAQAFLATATSATPHADIQAAQDVIVKDYEASLIPLSEVGNSLEKLRDIEPMQAASTARHMNELLAGMEEGNVPLWARPAVTKVEQALAGRGISASSIGRDSLFNAIISAAMPIAESDAAKEQDANKTNYNAKVQALFNDEAQIFAARQFNATTINQKNQFMTSLKAQVDQQNAARKDNMAQFNSQQRNSINMFNADAANKVSMANAANQTQVAVANANNATQVAVSNAQAANQLAMHQSSLDAQREQFNSQQQNAIAQSDVAWRRNLNTAETAGINAANQANVSNAFNLNNQAQQNLWQESRDRAHWAETATENEKARQHEGAMRLLVADIEAGRAEGAAGGSSAWDQAKDAFLSKGIDKATDWLLGD
jgi:hypothetical protein